MSPFSVLPENSAAKTYAPALLVAAGALGATIIEQRWNSTALIAFTILMIAISAAALWATGWVSVNARD